MIWPRQIADVAANATLSEDSTVTLSTPSTSNTNQHVRFDSLPTPASRFSCVADFLEHLEPEDCHHQTQSPLFGNLPAELRIMIFEFVLQPHENRSHAFGINQSFWHPDFMAPTTFSLGLLRVCRHIYLETSPLALKNVELHCFASVSNKVWRLYGPFCGDLRPLVESINRMPANQFKQLTRLHYHAHSSDWASASSFRFLLRDYNLPIKKATISFGSSSWSTLNSARPQVNVHSDPVRGIELPNSLDEFVVNFNAKDEKKKELEVVFAYVVNWKRVRKDGMFLTLTTTSPCFRSWMKVEKVAGSEEPAQMVTFTTGTLTWRCSRSQQ
ncbi:hypothetical protein EJ08DRAFT_485746 [Tothia fuscella]|uniref:Uncharacterized protein n=1 Tax=Tothia fuscella TaxID=1048955 RepID=A0A9P4NHZ7_9PEZI|nr:hypothetical protein EJ08DRAFT_485746 [Tothia fuscella]